MTRFTVDLQVVQAHDDMVAISISRTVRGRVDTSAAILLTPADVELLVSELKAPRPSPGAGLRKTFETANEL